MSKSKLEFSERYLEWNKVSDGTSGIIYKVFDVTLNSYIAVKEEKILEKSVGFGLKSEYEKLQKLQHPNIVKVYDYFSKYKCMTMEYASEGDLLSYVNDNPLLPEPVVERIYRQLIETIVFIHKSGFIHCDIKFENILLFNSKIFLIKLADFGFCDKYSSSPKKYRWGSLGYNAPEVISGAKVYGPELDIWSSGVVLFGLSYKHLPLPLPPSTTLREEMLLDYDKLKREGLSFPEHPFRSNGLKQLLIKILSVDSKTRITGPEILKSGWLSVAGTEALYLDFNKLLKIESPNDSTDNSPASNMSAKSSPGFKTT